jgi:alpha-maltose-1-phosphate synthase
MILLSHPTVNSTVRHVALALSRAGVLGEFWTCAQNQNAPHPCLIPPSTLSDASPIDSGNGRTSSILPAPNGSVRTAPPATRRRRLDSNCRSLDQTVSTRIACDHFKGVYAHEDSADESFRIAGLRGMLRVYDLAAGHWQAERDFCAEEAALEPEWAATLGEPQNHSPATERKDSELQQADLVIVPSTFMLRTLENVPTLPAAVALLSPGSRSPWQSSTTTVAASAAPGVLRVLFVGDLGQRKGLSYLFRACRELRGAVNLTVIGAPPHEACPVLERELRDVRWLPACSSSELHAEMACHDVLLAPSLFEGFDPVILDAMANGLPVVATPHTAAPDLIDHGVEGFIVPVRSTDEIVAKLEVLRREPDRRAEMSANARRRAQLHTWEGYERALAASVTTALSRH